MPESLLLWVPVIGLAVEWSKKLPQVNGHKERYSLLSVFLGMVVSVGLGGTVIDGIVLGLTACGGYSLVRKS